MTEVGEYFFITSEEDICEACRDCPQANTCSYFPQREKCWKEEDK